MLRWGCESVLMTSVCFPGNKYYILPTRSSVQLGKNRKCGKEYGWVLKATPWRAPVIPQARFSIISTFPLTSSATLKYRDLNCWISVVQDRDTSCWTIRWYSKQGRNSRFSGFASSLVFILLTSDTYLWSAASKTETLLSQEEQVK